MSTNKWSNLRDKRFSEEKVEEIRENLLLSTLQDYIHALGGRIEVNADIDDERVSLVKE